MLNKNHQNTVAVTADRFLNFSFIWSNLSHFCLILYGKIVQKAAKLKGSWYLLRNTWHTQRQANLSHHCTVIWPKKSLTSLHLLLLLSRIATHNSSLRLSEFLDALLCMPRKINNRSSLRGDSMLTTTCYGK